MSERKASTTALGVASLRAVHQLYDGQPRVLDDPVVLRLLGDETMRRIAENPASWNGKLAEALRAHVVIRSRYAEDRLAAAVSRGIRQCVILGAGLDTFAYRQPHWAHGIRIFEVDHPASQAAKHEMLQRAGVEVPGNVTFAGIDFEHETLRDGLERTGVSRTDLSFFSWLGVTMYLTRDAIEAVLGTIASFPCGSEVVLSFAPPRPPEEGEHPLAAGAADVGEPWVSYFTPTELAALLREYGFESIEFLRAEQAAEKYFVGTTLAPPRRVSVATAIV